MSNEGARSRNVVDFITCPKPTKGLFTCLSVYMHRTSHMHQMNVTGRLSKVSAGPEGSDMKPGCILLGKMSPGQLLPGLVS
ncbi:hypothetical protein LTR10_013798 [Elasticomyces elasticus]|uniref:Uncharacterized protein n=1 Tax=Exophiala sideris TaxID=1016849 RepID=A0ABR0JGX5_9EURO|nr:hypothetical protein LTR10_013798 [Elasticomyces elasticus]KAK5033227.1 hypothetical protein LTS07_003528 [Exophiala sideris]KAK5042276.1 hypothetical protein LTR13_002082 [Exophiala sideris]KAK5063771.1 hypothetical protein LTR69_003536 [Exophiala sideris]KAK5185544.1 hypothetical protein LTR44_002533 [Eurotiomycetes sp. CCFEE 6388]